MQIINLALAIITGLTLLFRYLLGDKRRRRILDEQIGRKTAEYAEALASNDTMRISLLHDELKRLRQARSRIKD